MLSVFSRASELDMLLRENLDELLLLFARRSA